MVKQSALTEGPKECPACAQVLPPWYFIAAIASTQQVRVFPTCHTCRDKRVRGRMAAPTPDVRKIWAQQQTPDLPPPLGTHRVRIAQAGQFESPSNSPMDQAQEELFPGVAYQSLTREQRIAIYRRTEALLKHIPPTVREPRSERTRREAAQMATRNTTGRFSAAS